MKFHLVILVFLFTAISSNAQELLKDSKTSKYGFFSINDDGDNVWIIQPQFDEGEDFFDYDFTFVKKGSKWGLINRKGETVLPFAYEKPHYGEYDESLRPVVKNKKHGIVSTMAGAEVIPCLYDKRLEYREEIHINHKMQILAIKNNKAGVIDSIGTILIPFAYDVSNRPFDFFETGLISTSQNKKAGMLDLAGNIVVPFLYDEVYLYMEMDSVLFDVQRKGKYGLYSREKKAELVPVIYDDRVFFDENGYAVVSRKKKFGVINTTGKEVVPCSLTLAQAMEELDKLLQSK